MISFEPLTISAEFGLKRAQLTLRGELDGDAGRSLNGLFAGLVLGGHRHVVLDLSGCSLIDVAGLRAIAEGAETFEAWGGELTVRAPSPAVRRVAALVKWPGFVALEQPEPWPATTASDPSAPRLAPGPAPHLADLVEQVSRVTAIPANSEVVDDALRMVVAITLDTVPAADAVSLSLLGQGELVIVAASHASAEALGFNAALTLPLLLEERPVGALNVYSRTVEVISGPDRALVEVLAAQASTLLPRARVDVDHEQLGRRLSEALSTRQVIALAQGIVMERYGVDDEHTYTSLRRFSAKTGRTLRERAEEVVASVHWPLGEAPARTADNG
jgi:anti-anti-sigma factor